MATGLPVILPRAGHNVDPYGIYIDKCVVTYDSDASSETFDILLDDDTANNEDTADGGVPLFIVPPGTIVLDVGVEVLVEATTATALMVGGPGASDSSAWLSTASYEASDITPFVVWGSQAMLSHGFAPFFDAFINGGAVADSDESDTVASTGFELLSTDVSNWGLHGGRVYYGDTTVPDGAWSSQGISTWATPVSPNYSAIVARTYATQITAGLFNFWIKYSLAGGNMPWPSSGYALTGD